MIHVARSRRGARRGTADTAGPGVPLRSAAPSGLLFCVGPHLGLTPQATFCRRDAAVHCTIDDMRVAAELSTARSLTDVAKRLSMPKQTVSRRLAELEASLGVRLVDRTTRTFRVTSLGRAYAAKTTPQIAIIDRDGILRYNGAIDSIPSADAGDIRDATQYARQALAEIAAGKPVSVATSEPYGCSVKYGG